MRMFYNNVFKNYFLLTVTLFVQEIIFKFVVGSSILEWSTLRIFIGINVISLLLSAIFSFCGRLVSNILSFIFAAICTIYAIAQAGFLNYLGVYMSFGTTSQAGAVKDYIMDYFSSFKWNFWLIAIPLAILLIFYIFADHRIKVLERNDMIDFADKFDSEDRKKKNDALFAKKRKSHIINAKINAVIIALFLAGAYYYTLSASFMQNDLQLKTNKELFNNPDMPNIAMNQFGFSMYSIIDLKAVILPNKNAEKTEFDNKYNKPEQTISDYTRYIDDTLWEQIIKEGSGNANKRKLNNYFISQKIEDKNDLTGFFKNKNLIVIMMESTNTMLINEEYFPNVYKLYNEGWAWDNAYSPRNSCSTGNNEMSGMVSLFTINNSCTANNYKNNVYPGAIFNLFNEAGYKTTSFHNYTDQYYARSVYHPNMGSGHFYGVQELGIPYSNVYKEWPSDVELIEKVLSVIKDQDKFMTWITSVSAHQPYTQSSELGDKHLDLFANTNYNISTKRYLSKLKEFDLAIGALLEGLESQGKLDDTVIVLYADHYPYGLTNSSLNAYFDYNVNTNYEIDRTPFIIYNSKTQPQRHREYTSYMNITPTVANLFDLDYDPRLYAGRDILSPKYENRVIFADGSWQDSKAFYNAASGKITYNQPNNTYTSEELKEINTDIKNRISMSNLAIKENYFKYLNDAIEEYKSKLELQNGDIPVSE